jgi:O-acetyl-ADP-ribose deacetylase (regulator of RNase III)
MTVRFLEGDMLQAKTDVLAHGVAAHTIEDMGTGIAKAINERWPGSFREFKKLRRSQGFKPGEAIVCNGTTPAIAYLATQPDLYHAEVRFVRKSLRALDKALEAKGHTSCSLPKIGCGYGKLDWEEVKGVIQERLGDSKINYSVYENFSDWSNGASQE